jgi:hypothetical protein
LENAEIQLKKAFEKLKLPFPVRQKVSSEKAAVDTSIKANSDQATKFDPFKANILRNAPQVSGYTSYI